MTQQTRICSRTTATGQLGRKNWYTLSLVYAAILLSLLAVGCASSPDVVHFKEGVALAKGGQVNEAAQAYVVALEANPGLIEARLNLGTMLYKQGRLTQAEREFRLVLSQDPEHVVARENLATTVYTQDKVCRTA